VGTKITNAVNSTGGATTIGLNVTAAFDGVSGAGFTGTTGAYPATAVQDSFFVQAAAVGKVKLTGLNPSQIYDLTFFGSRMGGGTNRVTQYKIGTITPATLDATDNTNYTISILGVTPAVDGTIEVEVKNDPGTGYGSLGVLELSIPSNQPPVVSAGSDQTITLPSTASLSGSVSDDGLAPGNPTPTVTWTKVSPAGSTVTFGTPNAVNTTATFSAAGTYVLRLTATDGVLSTSDDITVNVNAAPSSVLFDFGTITTSGNWNNVTTTTVGTKITAAINSTGGTTGIGLNVSAAFDNISGVGSTSPTGVYPANAMQDSFFVQTPTVGKVKLTGLNPSTSYTLTFFGSRIGGGANRVTQYKVGTTTRTLDATDNSTAVATMPGMTPAGDGTIEVEVKNDAGTGYGYLGVLQLDW
jgi:hypothetical protein